MTMFDLHTSLEQENQERQELEQTKQESALDTDLYSAGYLGGYIGAEPTHPEQYSYWAGYQIGYREYWAQRLGVEIPIEF